jgi:hypothetical protein
MQEMLAEIPVERDEVRARYDELRRAGYLWGAALRLAESAEVDLYDARRLLALGCPQETALRILL